MTKNNILIVGGIVVLLLIIAISTYIFSSPTSSAGEYDTFAQCVYDSGMRMYGSATCSFCAQQRKMFGNSFRFIREIECDPRNIGNQANLCIKKEISHTPTWIKEDAEGNDIERFQSGILSLEELSDASRCTLEKDISTKIKS